MTYKEKQQKLREIINRANPELNEDSWQWAKITLEENDVRVRNVEIVGHPIHLEHLLRAIEVSKGGKTYSCGIYSDGVMSFIDYSIDYADTSLEINYNLLLPPLEQKEEVIDALLDLLK